MYSGNNIFYIISIILLYVYVISPDPLSTILSLVGIVIFSLLYTWVTR